LQRRIILLVNGLQCDRGVMQDIEAIDARLRLLVAIRRMVREEEGRRM
jgi:hypothetical protein